MAKRYISTVQRARPGKEIRRKKTQRPFRQYMVTQRALIKPEVERGEDPWFWVEHRRGPKRPWVGEDPRELRAVPKTMVFGTLPERIVYKSLLDYGLQEGTDFDFQSSLMGGRIELGGMVADFLFERGHMVIRVQGPGHQEYEQRGRDTDQKQRLERMGFAVYDIADIDVYDQVKCRSFLQGILQSRERRMDEEDAELGPSEFELNPLYDELLKMERSITDAYG